MTEVMPTIYLPGAGGGVPDLGLLRAGLADATRFEVIGYPGWQRYTATGFSTEALIAELADRVAAAVPDGPIRLVGHSIGGHFGYAIALRLLAMGREIGGVCAIDSYIVTSAADRPDPGWQRRAFADGLALVRRGKVHDLALFARSKIWRAVMRLMGNRLETLAPRGGDGGGAALSRLDPVMEMEYNMRLLLRLATPWLASLDRDPVPLMAPVALLRTVASRADDAAWRRRCPTIDIHEIAGTHHTVFDADHVASLRAALGAAMAKWPGHQNPPNIRKAEGSS